MLKKWKLLKSKAVFKNPWLGIEKHTYRLPEVEEEKDYYHLTRPNYVLVIAVDDDQRLIIEKQYRRGVDDFVYELPAGWIEKAESPEEAAQREVEEELGFGSREVQLLGEIFPQPGFSSMRAFAVLVKLDSKRKGDFNLEKDEFIEFEHKTRVQITDMIKRHEIKDMGFLAAFQLYQALREKTERPRWP